MREYHFYMLDPQSHILAREVCQCADDISAVETAQKMKAACDIEIWFETHLVTRLNAQAPPRARHA